MDIDLIVVEWSACSVALCGIVPLVFLCLLIGDLCGMPWLPLCSCHMTNTVLFVVLSCANSLRLLLMPSCALCGDCFSRTFSAILVIHCNGWISGCDARLRGTVVTWCFFVCFLNCFSRAVGHEVEYCSVTLMVWVKSSTM